MRKFKSTITNPMTVIAIFATLSETSAAISLPFLDDEEKETYIWFLISFPFYWILLFFITLNFNYRSLYAPSDFVKGKHFIKVMDNCRVEDAISKKAIIGPRHQHPASVEDPPERPGVRTNLFPREPVRLPASFKDLQIFDTRGKNRKRNLRELFERFRCEKSDAPRLVLFITGRDPEKSLRSCAPKFTENAGRHCTSVFCVAYNVISREMTVLAEAWPFATKNHESEQQDRPARKQSEDV